VIDNLQKNQAVKGNIWNSRKIESGWKEEGNKFEYQYIIPPIPQPLLTFLETALPIFTKWEKTVGSS
jgi:hypothetical protein